MSNAKLKCKFCKEWFDSSNVVRNGLSTYCSSDCQSKDFYRSLQKLGQRKLATKGSDGPSDETVRAVRAADGYKCRVCGRPGELITHHVYYRSEKEARPFLHQKHNLISLHNDPCHLGIVHGNKERFKPLLLGLIWLREIEGDNSMTVYQLEERDG